MPPAPAQALLEYESAATQRRGKLWQLALTTTKVPLLLLYVIPHLALLATYETTVLLIGQPTLTVGKTANSVTLFIVGSVFLRLGYYAMLSVPLLMITYNLIDHLSNRRAVGANKAAREPSSSGS